MTVPGLSSAVALDAETALVGAKGTDIDGNIDQGATYVFVRQGEEWVEEAQLVAADGAAGDFFGNSVALDGDTAVVGAWLAHVDGEIDQGAAYVFQRSSGQWGEPEKLVASDGDRLDNFGYAVALDGDTIAVGSWNADEKGAVYVFVRQGLAWAEEAKLSDPAGVSADLFGTDVALEGDTLLVGAQSATIEGDPSRGAAYVYVRSAGIWELEQKLLASDGACPDQFGNAVALDRDTALIGAWQKDFQEERVGAAYIFRRSGTTWTEEQRLTPSESQENGFFGEEVALLENVALVGAEFDFPGNPQQGVVHEFRRQAGAWAEIQGFTAPQGNGIDGFGHRMALTADRALISHEGEVVLPPAGGSAWIFGRPVVFEDGFESGGTSSWSQTVP